MGNPKLIYKPTVKHGILGQTITYYNREKRQRVSFEIDDIETNLVAKAIQELPRQIANLVSGKKPNIDPDQLLDAFYSNIKAGSSVGHGGYIADIDAVAHFLERLVNKFRQPESEGGKMITPNEQYDMMKQWHQWFGNYD